MGYWSASYAGEDFCGFKAQEALSKVKVMGGELYGRRGCTAEDAKLDKTLTIDISRKLRHPMVIMSVDAANCYDRVNHVIMSFFWFALLKGFRSPIQAAL